MHIFELLAEYHLPQEQIIQHSEDFMKLFTNCLKDETVTVKVAALKAITSFLSSIDEESAVLKYQGIMSQLIDVVIEVLRSDEEKGRASMETLIELTQNHGEIWNQDAAKLIYVVSQVIQNKNFENETRQTALEIISTLAEDQGALVRKHGADLKQNLMPAIAHMLSEVDDQDDINAWANKTEEEL